MRRVLPWYLLLSAAALGCQDDPAFLPLDQLCPQRAESLCNALAHCCGADKVPANCQLVLRDACEGEQRSLATEDLSYFAPRASELLSEQRETWQDCGSVLPVAAYYQDGLPNGAACERPTQCAEGACSSEGTCASAAAVLPELCLAPEP